MKKETGNSPEHILGKFIGICIMLAGAILTMKMVAGIAEKRKETKSGKGRCKEWKEGQSIQNFQNPHKNHTPYGPYEAYWKRPLDFIFSFLLMLFLLPVLLVLALLVKVKLGSPIFFMQERPGIDGKIFTLYKFRSMSSQTDANGKLLPDEVRLTKFGRLLRATSLDELPELYNIWKGDMSFIGPRPLLVQYLPLYDGQQARRHEVRPGVTGYAQVHGRNAITWEEKFEKDVWYVDHVSFWQDAKILLSTVKTVLKREGIHSDTSVTMEEFRGSQESLR